MTGPGVGDGVLVAGVARRPAGNVDETRRGEGTATAPSDRVGDHNLDGQRTGLGRAGHIDTDVEVERSGGAVGFEPGHRRRVGEGDGGH